MLLGRQAVIVLWVLVVAVSVVVGSGFVGCRLGAGLACGLWGRGSHVSAVRLVARTWDQLPSKFESSAAQTRAACSGKHLRKATWLNGQIDTTTETFRPIALPSDVTTSSDINYAAADGPSTAAPLRFYGNWRTRSTSEISLVLRRWKPPATAACRTWSTTVGVQAAHSRHTSSSSVRSRQLATVGSHLPRSRRRLLSSNRGIDGTGSAVRPICVRHAMQAASVGRCSSPSSVRRSWGGIGGGVPSAFRRPAEHSKEDLAWRFFA
nr:hypothetical protein Iba_chr10aCG12820 [Ipomoea batatas]